jgi:hypothetical protein
MRRDEPVLYSVLVTAAAAVIFVASPARAANGELRAGASAGVALLYGKPGPAIGAFGAYGLGDVLDAIVEVRDSWHPANDGTNVFNASLGLVAKFDVVQWVPYAGLLAGYYVFSGTPTTHGEHGSELGASAQLGADFLVTRQMAIGVDGRLDATLTSGFHLPLVTVMLGAAYKWE